MILRAVFACYGSVEGKGTLCQDAIRSIENRSNHRGKRRRGAAAVELVLVLPVLCLICLVAVDYSRVFFARAILADCARNGALYASDSNFASSTSFTSIHQAALADASDLSPAPTITSTSGTDSSGNA